MQLVPGESSHICSLSFHAVSVQALDFATTVRAQNPPIAPPTAAMTANVHLNNRDRAFMTSYD